MMKNLILLLALLPGIAFGQNCLTRNAGSANFVLFGGLPQGDYEVTFMHVNNEGTSSAPVVITYLHPFTDTARATWTQATARVDGSLMDAGEIVDTIVVACEIIAPTPTPAPTPKPAPGGPVNPSMAPN